jgi:hypothetical protein
MDFMPGRLIRVVMFFALVACAADPPPVPAPGDHARQGAQSGSPTPAAEEQAAAGEVLVRFRDGTRSEEAVRVLQKLGLAGESVSPGANLFRVKIPAGATIEETIEKLKACPEVVYAEPNYLRKLK